MSNWFAGIGQSASGMNAARYGLSVVSQNIANADTDGYTRQVANQQSVDFSPVSALYTQSLTPGSLGGVKIAGTTRLDDSILDARVRSEHANGQLADTTASQLSSIEQVFPEPGDNGLGGQLTAFWKSWATVGNEPGTAAARQQLLQSASTVVGTLHSLSASLSDIAGSTSQSLDQDLGSATTAAAQLATLNGQIGIASATGVDVNGLLDQRDQLLDSLSKLVGGVATINANGSADVTVNGAALVSGSTAATISADSNHQVSVGGTAVTLSTGSAAARVTALTTTIPGYQAKLDAVADSLSSTVNGVQSSGYDLAGNTGTAMFTGSGAAGITLAFTDTDLVAASGTPGGNLDGSHAQAASGLGTSTTGPDAGYTLLVGDVAATSADAQSRSATQDAVVANVDSLHASISGVSYDEEVGNMLTYQRSFDASSRVLTTLDDMLDTLINHTGRAGLA